MNQVLAFVTLILTSKFCGRRKHQPVVADAKYGGKPRGAWGKSTGREINALWQWYRVLVD
jgi:hypothetical protein